MISVLVRKKPDRRTYQLYYVDPLTGRDVTRSAKTDNRREAERAAAIWESELDRRGMDANSKMSWDVFRVRFEAEFLEGKPKNTRSSYMAAINHWESIVGHIRQMSMLSPSVVSRFASVLGTRVSTVTVATHLRHLRAVFRWAESMEILQRAPKVVMPKTNRRRLSRSRAITTAEYELIRASVIKLEPHDPGPWQRFLDLLWLSGLRIGEAQQLSWDSPPIRVDLDDGRYPRICFFAEGQKSREDEMSVIPPDLAEWLSITPSIKRTGLVCPLPRKLNRSTVSHVICQIGKAANVSTAPGKFASAHDFRRAFGQRWAKIVRPITLQKMMRHATISTTLAYYVDMDESDVGSELYVPLDVPRNDYLETDREK